MRTKQRKIRYSSWLTEAANYGAEPVEPVPNRFSWLIKNPRFGLKVPKWLRKQTKETVLNFELGWVRTGQRKAGVPHGWQRQPAMVLNRLNWLIKNPKFGQKVPKWLRKKTKETVLNSEPGWVRTRQRKAGVPHGWQRQPVMVLNRLNWFPKIGRASCRERV